MRQLIVFGGALAFSATLVGSSARAVSIGVNFEGGGNASSPPVSLAATDVAGVVPQANWNNFAASSGASVTGIVDSTGAVVSGLSLTYTSGGTYSSIGGATIAPAGGDEELNTGFIYGSGTVTVTGLPFSYYNLYVYELNDASARVETTTLTSPATSTLTYYNSAASPSDSSHVDQSSSTPYVYTQTTSENAAAPTAASDYVGYFVANSSSFTFTTSAPGNGYVNGFEIVQVAPEPASLGLGAVAAVGLLARRRRAR